MDAKLLSTFLSSAVGIIVPIAIWYLNKKDKNQEVENIEKQIIRLNLIERISQISVGSDIDMKSVVEIELEKAIAVLNDHESKSELARIESVQSSYHTLPRWRQILLLFKPRNFTVFLLQAIFFYVTYGLISNIISLISGDLVDTLQEAAKDDPLPSSVIYVIVTFIAIVQLIIMKVVHSQATKYQIKD